MKSRIFDHLPAVRTLVLVIDKGSLTEAGRALGLSPSAVSKQIGRLEEALGARLLERTTRHVRPTLAGLELCQRARPLLEAFDDAARAVRAERETIAGQLRISAAPAFGRAVLLPALAALGSAHRDLRFDVTLTGRRVDLLEEDVDAAIREGTLEDSSVVARPLCVARVGLYASPDYVTRRGAPRALADLSRHDVVSIPAARIARHLPEDLRRLTRSARFRVDDLFSVAELAEAGAGLAPLPDYVARPRVASGALVRVLARTEIAELPIHFVYPSRRHLPQRVHALFEALRAQLS